MLISESKNISRQKKFIADVSHELRTPITVIKNYVEILESFGAEDPELFHESMTAIKIATENMQNLVDSLLFLARADENAHCLRKIPVELNDLIDSVIKQIKNPRIQIISDKKFFFMGDPEFLKKMLGEFLKNAILYSSDKIFVEIQTAEDFATVKITDSGIGIAAEDLDKIFDRFYRADKSRTKIDYNKNSPGLGLSIAKWIADEHGIKISVTSELGKGSTFELLIANKLSARD